MASTYDYISKVHDKKRHLKSQCNHRNIKNYITTIENEFSQEPILPKHIRNNRN